MPPRDGKGNIFWRDTNTGTLAIWEVNGFQVVQSASLGAIPLNWTIAGVGDFDGNGSTDILWRDGNTGTMVVWLMNGLAVKQQGSLGAVPSNWNVAQTGDFDGDYKSDLLWRDNLGNTAIWFMNGTTVASTAPGAMYRPPGRCNRSTLSNRVALTNTVESGSESVSSQMVRAAT